MAYREPYFNHYRPGGEFRQLIKTLAPVNTAVIAVNVIAFIVLEIMGDTENSLFMLEHGAAYAGLIFDGHEYWRLLTSMFLHFGVRHLFNNMLVLAFVGDRLEKTVGKWRYIVIYFGGGIIGGFISALIDYRAEAIYISAGASGAVFAVVGALAWILIINRGRLKDISMFQIVMFILFSFYLGFQGGGVDNAAHVSGLISGFILSAILCRRRFY